MPLHALDVRVPDQRLEHCELVVFAEFVHARSDDVNIVDWRVGFHCSVDVANELILLLAAPAEVGRSAEFKLASRWSKKRCAAVVHGYGASSDRLSRAATMRRRAVCD